MASRQFAVAPPGKAAWITMLLLAVLLPAAALLTAIAHSHSQEDVTAMLVLLPILLVLGIGVTLLMCRRSVALVDGMLVVRAAMFTHRVPTTEVDADAARIVDLREHTALRPLLKTNGYAVPGFKAGRFRLRSGKRAFLLVTDTSRVVQLPVAGDRMLLLSIEPAQALVDALRRQQA